MCTVNIGIGHYNYFVVSKFRYVEVLSDICSQCHYNRSKLIVAINLVHPGFFNVEHLTQRGRMAWNLLFLPCFAEPPAESPSTINISQREGSLSVQSASFPGSVEVSRTFFLLVSSLAFRAASLALADIIHLSSISLVTDGFPQGNLQIFHLLCFQQNFLPHCYQVWSSSVLQIGVGYFTLMTAVKPSLTSSPKRFYHFPWENWIFSIIIKNFCYGRFKSGKVGSSLGRRYIICKTVNILTYTSLLYCIAIST